VRQHSRRLDQPLNRKLRGLCQPDYDAELDPPAERDPQQRADADLAVSRAEQVIEGPADGARPRQRQHLGDQVGSAPAPLIVLDPA
jgi:hypothetical protein